MKKYFAGAMVIAIAGVAGCASTAESEAYLRQSHANKDADKEALVGTRLVKPTTERIVNVIGNQEYSELNQHTGIANRVSTPGK